MGFFFIALLCFSGSQAASMNNSELDQGNSTESSAGILGAGIVGIFDHITGLTKEVGGLFGEFEEGFQKIRPINFSIGDQSIRLVNYLC